jgi:hypothetical protein
MRIVRTTDQVLRLRTTIDAMSTPDISHRPCGACAELISTDEGCRHWKPGTKSGKRHGWVRGRARKEPDCTCGKAETNPGPPTSHSGWCAKVVGGLALDRQVSGTIE